MHRKDLKMNILATGRKPLHTDFQEYRAWSFSKAPVLVSNTIINKTPEIIILQVPTFIRLIS